MTNDYDFTPEIVNGSCQQALRNLANNEGVRDIILTRKGPVFDDSTQDKQQVERKLMLSLVLSKTWSYFSRLNMSYLIPCFLELIAEDSVFIHSLSRSITPGIT